jgi:hypothetical protein
VVGLCGTDFQILPLCSNLWNEPARHWQNALGTNALLRAHRLSQNGTLLIETILFIFFNRERCIFWRGQLLVSVIIY